MHITTDADLVFSQLLPYFARAKRRIAVQLDLFVKGRRGGRHRGCQITLEVPVILTLDGNSELVARIWRKQVLKKV